MWFWYESPLRMQWFGRSQNRMDTWGQRVQLIVSAVGQIAAQSARVDLRRGRGCGTEGEPSAEQVLLLHCASQSVNLQEKRRNINLARGSIMHWKTDATSHTPTYRITLTLQCNVLTYNRHRKMCVWVNVSVPTLTKTVSRVLMQLRLMHEGWNWSAAWVNKAMRLQKYLKVKYVISV